MDSLELRVRHSLDKQMIVGGLAAAPRAARPQQADTAAWAGRTPTPAMAAVHGFLAGWGLGAFALIMATVLAPAMPSAALGWVPGAAFGLGTTAVLAGVGTVIGSLIRRQRLPEHLAQRVAQEGAGWTLLAGGALFIVAGTAGLAVPSVMTAGIATGIHILGLDKVGAGTLLVILIVAVAAVTIARTVHRLRRVPARQKPPTGIQAAGRRAGHQVLCCSGGGHSFASGLAGAAPGWRAHRQDWCHGA